MKSTATMKTAQEVILVFSPCDEAKKYIKTKKTIEQYDHLRLQRRCVQKQSFI